MFWNEYIFDITIFHSCFIADIAVTTLLLLDVFSIFLEIIVLMFLTVCSFQGTYCVTVFQLLLTVSSHNIKEFLSSILWLEIFFSFFQSGSHLLSHAVSSIVSSAVYVLTIVFGMGTGVSHKRIATRNIFVINKNACLSFAPLIRSAHSLSIRY